MNESQTLGALIQERQASTGWSLRDLSERSPAGTGLNKDRWGELRRDEVKSFSGPQLRGVAEALGISESVVGRAALATMGLAGRDGDRARVEDAVRTDNELSEHDRRILLAVLREMRTERGGNVSTAPITQAGESPATEQERHERTAADSGVAAMESGMPDEDRQVGDDDLARRRRERAAGEVVPLPLDDVPMPDEELMAGYDAPSEGKALREAQDADAEGPQE